MRRLFATTFCGFMVVAAAQAAPLFFDNFDNSFPGEPAFISSIWPKWPTATDHLNLSDNRSHTELVCGTCTNSVRQDPQDPYTLANYHDFGAAAVGVTADIWFWDDNSAIGNATSPVNFYVGFYGDSTNGPTANTDYLLLGLSPTFADFNTYGYRSLTGGAGDTGITRSVAKAGSADGSGWIKLTIQADALDTGGQTRFYINNALVGTTYREPGVNLRYFFMGSQSKNYEFFWYDDITINAIPEITGITVSNGLASIDFISAASDQATNFTLVSASAVNGGYSPAAGAAITGSNGVYQATVSTNGLTQFYRIQR